MFKLTRGRTTFSGWLADLPGRMAHHDGRQERCRAHLAGACDPCGDGRLVVIASNYGQRNNPSWYHNLRANPRARVNFDGAELEMVARVLEGGEREQWYERGIDIYPGWVEYREAGTAPDPGDSAGGSRRRHSRRVILLGWRTTPRPRGAFASGWS